MRPLALRFVGPILALAILTAPLAAEGQPAGKVPRIGFLTLYPASP